MIRNSLIALSFVLPSTLLADSRLDRLEALSEKMNLAMAEMMARELINAGGDAELLMAALPDTTWNDEYREAGQCLLDKYEELAGKDGVDVMLGKMEAALPEMETATLETLEKLDFLPDGVTDDQSIEITKDCGLMEIGMRRSEESGFSAAMMKAYSEINQ